MPKENVNERFENDRERPSTSFQIPQNNIETPSTSFQIPQNDRKSPSTSIQIPQNNRERPSTSFHIPQNLQSLKEAIRNKDIPRTRKPSSGTSIDNNAPRSETPHESNFLEFQYFQDNIGKKLDNNNIYPVDPDNPGIVLIINQEHFYTEFDPQYKVGKN